MRLTSFLFTIFFAVLVWNSSLGQKDNIPASFQNDKKTASATTRKYVNFFIISKRKKGKLDLGTRFDILRGKIKSLFRRKKFVAIVAKDMQQVAASIKCRLQEPGAAIGTLWFDSHGTYQKGYSVFRIGKDELNYQSIRDSTCTKPLLSLAALTNERTKIVIGSCYGGATYLRKSVHSNDTLRMNGDSLMIGLGKIFNRSTIYGSESWVMTKPGLFSRTRAVTGHPSQKCYKDLVYRPAWENVSKWNAYNAATEIFSVVNPVTMDGNGNMIILSKNVAGWNRTKRDIEKNVKKLKPGLLKVK